MSYDGMFQKICWDCVIQAAIVFGALSFDMTKAFFTDNALFIAGLVLVAGFIAKPIGTALMGFDKA